MQMDAGLDTGEIVLMNELDIAPEETSSTLHHRLAELGAQSIVDTLNRLQAGIGLVRTPQAMNGVTYAEKILKSEAEIDWNLSAQEIDRRIRAFNPFPGATSNAQELEMKFWNSRIPKAGAFSKAGLPGELLGFSEKGAYIQCGQGAIEVLEMQKPGGKKSSAKTCLQTSCAPDKVFCFQTKYTKTKLI
jgi:methionyl-tRNA formyltransferase